MIEETRNYYYLYCDVCGCEADDVVFYRFDDVLDYKKQHGWGSQKYRGEWEDVCPDCKARA